MIIDKAIAIIKEFEGFRADAYPDPRTGDEPWTIGYGTTWYASGDKVEKGDKVTEERALRELKHKVTDLHTQLKREIKVPLTDGQWAAMISFAYNMGVAGAQRQIDRLNANKIPEFMVKHIEYINKGSSVEAGLRRRRIAELELFNEEEPVSKVTWINLVRNTEKGFPEYLAYLMNGSVCLEIKPWKTRSELIAILQSTEAGNVAVGTENWHVEQSTKIPDNKKLLTTVPYFSQRDYGGSQAWSICGCTSVAMVLAYYGLDVTPDTVLRGYGKASCQSPVGCEAVFEANKLKANSTYNGTWKQIRDQLDQDRPVVIHGRFTASGHIIVVIGYDENGYYCNDPAGKWEQVTGDSYLDNPKNGAGVYYREEAMWKACGKDRDVWYSVAFR